MLKCRGFFIPQYRLERHIKKNLVPLPDKNDKIGNVADEEFEVNYSYRELDPVCADCKQSLCRGFYGSEKREEKNEL